MDVHWDPGIVGDSAAIRRSDSLADRTQTVCADADADPILCIAARRAQRVAQELLRSASRTSPVATSAPGLRIRRARSAPGYRSGECRCHRAAVAIALNIASWLRRSARIAVQVVKLGNCRIAARKHLAIGLPRDRHQRIGTRHARQVRTCALARSRNCHARQATVAPCARPARAGRRGCAHCRDRESQSPPCTPSIGCISRRTGFRQFDQRRSSAGRCRSNRRAAGLCGQKLSVIEVLPSCIYRLVPW